MQLNELLRRRTAEEQQQVAARKAEVAQELFREERARAQQLEAEVCFLRLTQCTQ